MDVIVCIKQVPDVAEVKWDPKTGSLIRKGVKSIINPNDKNAIEAALALKEKHGGQITILSMGPSQVESILREALAMGADHAVQLTDKMFAGADTWVTSYTLGLAIKKIGEFDLILCGKEVLDGMTAQVGPQLAEFLGLPQLTYAVDIQIFEDKVRIKQKFDNILRIIESPMPALITVERELNQPRITPMDKIIDAFNKEIQVLKAQDLNGEESNFGLKGSPTKIKEVFTPKRLKGKVEMIDGSPDQMADSLINKMKEKYII